MFALETRTLLQGSSSVQCWPQSLCPAVLSESDPLLLCCRPPAMSMVGRGQLRLAMAPISAVMGMTPRASRLPAVLSGRTTGAHPPRRLSMMHR